MKDMIGGLQVLICIVVVGISFGVSPVLGVISLVVIGFIVLRSAGKKAYKDDPKLMNLATTLNPSLKLIIPNSSKEEIKQVCLQENNGGSRFCTNCGERILTDSNFCRNCGRPVEIFDSNSKKDKELLDVLRKCK